VREVYKQRISKIEIRRTK